MDGPTLRIVRPVFVDGSGRRKWWFLRIGTAAGLGLTVFLGLIAAGLAGQPDMTAPLLPDQGTVRQFGSPNPSPGNAPGKISSGPVPQPYPTAPPPPAAPEAPETPKAPASTAATTSRPILNGSMAPGPSTQQSAQPTGSQTTRDKKHRE